MNDDTESCVSVRNIKGKRIALQFKMVPVTQDVVVARYEK